MKALFGKDQVEVGYVVAMRGMKAGPKATGLKLMQVSVYADAQYIGTLARSDDGAFVAGVDPWVREDLLHYSGFEDAGRAASGNTGCSTRSIRRRSATTCRRA